MKMHLVKLIKVINAEINFIFYVNGAGWFSRWEIGSESNGKHVGGKSYFTGCCQELLHCFRFLLYF